jgi:hypothetical protein
MSEPMHWRDEEQENPWIDPGTVHPETGEWDPTGHHPYMEALERAGYRPCLEGTGGGCQAISVRDGALKVLLTGEDAQAPHHADSHAFLGLYDESRGEDAGELVLEDFPTVGDVGEVVGQAFTHGHALRRRWNWGSGPQGSRWDGPKPGDEPRPKNLPDWPAR